MTDVTLIGGANNRTAGILIYMSNNHPNQIFEATSTYAVNDGGRAAAGYRGVVADYAVRAIAIATGADYKATYKAAAAHNKAHSPRPRPASKGIAEVDAWMSAHGYKQVEVDTDWLTVSEVAELFPNSIVGTGSWSVRYQGYEFTPPITDHLAAIVDGVVQDIWNSEYDFRAPKPMTSPRYVKAVWIRD